MLSLEHDQTNSAHVLLAALVSGIDTARNRRSTVVVHVVVQRTIARTKALFFEEEGVIEQGERVEDVELGLEGVLLAMQATSERIILPSSLQSARP